MEFSVKSNISNNAVVFSCLEPEYFTALIVGNVSATVRVCTYTDELGLLNFFQKLAGFKRPWKGKLEWEPIESQFTISAECSSLGEVVLAIELRDLFGHPEEWCAKTHISAEMGQLHSIAAHAKVFFNQ